MNRRRDLLLTVLALGIAALPAASPYLFGEGLPRTNDALPHLYRVVALDRLVQAGQLWPRWSPDLVHGYGYPVFNFFPALSHWLVELLHLPGLGLTGGFGLAIFVHLWLAAAGAYFLGRAWFSAGAGWAAAIAYVYSPYLLYDAHVRGSLPETQALALLPWLLLALWRSADSGRRWIVLSAGIFAAMFLSHYGMMFQILLLTGLWLLALGWRRGWRALAGPFAGLALGVLLTAFFWLPALLEIGDTQADLSMSRGYGYAENFLTLRQMIAWPYLPADPALINPPVVRALPVAALLLAGAALLWSWRSIRGEIRRQLITWLGLLLLSLWLVTPSSRLVWQTVPLLAETFYPWRMLGFTSLAGAVLLALAADLVLQRNRRPWLVAGAVSALLLIAAIPWLYPPREPVAPDPDLAALLRFEAPPLFIGTTTLGEFLPRWVEEMPDTAALREALLADGEAERLLPAGGVTFRRLGGPVWNAAYEVQADETTTLTYRQFYFPGWQARLDGEPLAVHPGEPHGLVTVTVPPGEHRLELAFGSTTPRRIGTLLTVLGIAGSLLVATARLPWPDQPEKDAGRAETGRNGRKALILGGLVVAVWLFFTFVETPLRRATLGPDSVLGRPVVEPLDFAGEIRLLSLEAPEEPVATDDPVPVTLSLRALRPIGVPYLVGVDVIDGEGLVWSASRERPADWRFVAGEEVWPADGYRLEPFVLRLLDGTPPGEYRFRIGLVREDTGQTVTTHEAGRLVVGEPARGDRPLEEGMAAHEGQRFAGLALLGSRADRREAAPGDPVRLALLWHVVDPEEAASAGPVVVRLLSTDGQTLVEASSPVAGSYPATSWRAGDRLRTEILLRLPAGTPGGEHRWTVARGGPEPAGQGWPLGAIRVEAPERRYTLPPLDVTLDARLGEVATLAGASWQPATLSAGGNLDVTLVWRSEAETATSYRVFLHLLGPEGNVVSQSDGEPVGWTRPTSGWLPGEIVVEERPLTLPAELGAGEYTLLAGLYDGETGARLPLPNGEDAVAITRFTYPEP